MSSEILFSPASTPSEFYDYAHSFMRAMAALTTENADSYPSLKGAYEEYMQRYLPTSFDDDEQ